MLAQIKNIFSRIMVSLPDSKHDQETSEATIISAVVLLVMWTLVCLVATARSGTLGDDDGQVDDNGQEDDERDDDYQRDVEETSDILDSSYLLEQNDLKDHKIEIICGSKIGSKWYVKTFFTY